MIKQDDTNYGDMKLIKMSWLRGNVAKVQNLQKSLPKFSEFPKVLRVSQSSQSLPKFPESPKRVSQSFLEPPRDPQSPEASPREMFILKYVKTF